MRLVLSSLRRAVSVAVVVTLSVLIVIPGTAAAATRPITFSVYMPDNCVNGRASDNASVKLVWRNAARAIKLSTTVTANPYGGWYACASASTLVKPGDTLKATVGSASRKFVVPNLTLVVDRVNDVFRGKGPAGATLYLNYSAGIFADYNEEAYVTVDASGNWEYAGDPEVGELSVYSGQDASVEWLSAKGDTIWASGRAPYLRVRLGRSTFAGETNPGQGVKVVLRDPATDAFKAKGTAIVNEPGFGFDGQFRDKQGNAVALAAGDHLVAPSIAADADWIVPIIEASANTSTDVVSGRCFDPDTQPRVANVNVYRTGHQRGYAHVFPDEQGHFEVDMWARADMFFDPANIKHGDRIVIECGLPTGDWVEMGFRVP